jgi:glycosyltransferase involved in cell wall biosynthesis
MKPAQLVEIEEKLGRPLRVLHIGNIANNAYINAKIMRRIGIEADVLCLDYYHIMGCPEWEDAELEAFSENGNKPVWSRVNLNGFKRPDWFYQGPSTLIKRIFQAQINNQKFKEGFFRWFSKHIVFYQEKSFIWLLAKVWAKVTAFKKRAFIFCRDLIRKQRLVHQGVKKASFYISCTKRLFPHPLSKQHSSPWTEIFKKYDIIQGYALDGKYPLQANVKNWAAYEHGTIRDIPFEDTEMGRTCRQVYQAAPIVFVTNSDCLAAAEKLEIASDRVYPIPHAFDSKKVKDFCDKWQSQATLFEIPTFLAPARHHWKEGFPTWLKGNDKIIRAVSRLKKLNKPFHVFFVDWGIEVDLSKQLIKELDIADCVSWLPPMTKFELWKMYLRVDAVLDQFVVPAMGSVSFESLAFGKPLITRIDEPVLERFFGKSPPLINAHDAETIYEALKPMLENRDFYKEIGNQARCWVDQYHSSERILEIQLKAYNQLFRF